ncbi:hypothetical protein [Planococcus halotolerans]|uniref:hypothetical protein n=1 Tax=Planococcus halotolerans TaxID=2233542 RepID=UPI001057F385|nr:hypothetical protein [Planococcus halotolerans]QHJ70584.1 hypothetical protein DNR44_008185 [Planococcus halotolerans]
MIEIADASSSLNMNFNFGGNKMSKTIQAKVMEEQQVILCKSQEEFAKALREGTATAEENGFMEETDEK